MSLDVYLMDEKYGIGLYTDNITHNLGKMADEAGIYKALWRPEEIVPEPRAKDISEIVRQGLMELVSRPSHYKQFDAENGWAFM